MVDKKISDLTDIVRPLATDLYEAESVAEGSVDIDYATLLAGPMLPAICQPLGFTSANIVEVEALTKAMRVTIRPTDLGGGQDLMFTVSRHCVGAQTSLTLTTASYTDFAFFAGWWSFPGVAFLNKCSIAVATSAVVGARVGVTMMRLCPVYPMVSAGAASNLIVPPLGTPVANVNAATAPGAPTGASNGLYNSLSNQQMPPAMFITGAVNSVSTPISGLEVASRNLGMAVGSTRALVGEQNIPPHTIFDALGVTYQPYTMATNTGFLLAGEGPAAGTSQTVNVSANFQWDEWVPIVPSRT